MKYTRDIAAILGGMLVGYAPHASGALHWLALIAGGALIAAAFTVLSRKPKRAERESQQ